MNLRRGAFMLAILVGCGRFAADDPVARPPGVEAGAPEADAGDGGEAPTPGTPDAGDDGGTIRGPFCETLKPTDPERDLRCWDFTSSNPLDGFDDGELSGNNALFERDETDFASGPASLHAWIDAGQPQLQARGVFRMPAGAMTPGNYRFELSLRSDCVGGLGMTDDEAPPSILELYCDDGPDSASVFRISREDGNRYSLLGSNLVNGAQKPFSRTVPADGWHRIAVDVTMFQSGGTIRIAIDGKSDPSLPLDETLQCKKNSAKLRLLVGLQDAKSTASCAMHYDDVVFERPKP